MKYKLNAKYFLFCLASLRQVICDPTIFFGDCHICTQKFANARKDSQMGFFDLKKRLKVSPFIALVRSEIGSHKGLRLSQESLADRAVGKHLQQVKRDRDFTFIDQQLGMWIRSCNCIPTNAAITSYFVNCRRCTFPFSHILEVNSRVLHIKQPSTDMLLAAHASYTP